jgi:hypothetical protein
MVNERGSNGKITAIFQPQLLPFKNGITVYSRIVPLNRYQSAQIAHAWSTIWIDQLLNLNYLNCFGHFKCLFPIHQLAKP